MYYNDPLFTVNVAFWKKMLVFYCFSGSVWFHIADVQSNPFLPCQPLTHKLIGCKLVSLHKYKNTAEFQYYLYFFKEKRKNIADVQSIKSIQNLPCLWLIIWLIAKNTVIQEARTLLLPGPDFEISSQINWFIWILPRSRINSHLTQPAMC